MTLFARLNLQRLYRLRSAFVSKCTSAYVYPAATRTKQTRSQISGVDRKPASTGATNQIHLRLQAASKKRRLRYIDAALKGIAILLVVVSWTVGELASSWAFLGATVFLVAASLFCTLFEV